MSDGQTTPNSNKPMYVPKGPKPVFLRSEDVRNGDTKPLTGEELYVALSKFVTPVNITGIQQIRHLWRIYLEKQPDRVKLITTGLEIRGATAPVHDINPFTKAREENHVRVLIKDVPLSVSDEVIKSDLKARKVNVEGDIYRQKLRVNGQLTSCLNGDRVLYIKPPLQRLPRKILLGGIFMARVYHQGQPEQSNKGVVTCSKCLENGHHVSMCNNVVKCRMCMQSGHVKGNCPNATHHLATDREKQRSGTNTSLTQGAMYSEKARKQSCFQDFLPVTRATTTRTSSTSNTSNKSKVSHDETAPVSAREMSHPLMESVTPRLARQKKEKKKAKSKERQQVLSRQ